MKKSILNPNITMNSNTIVNTMNSNSIVNTMNFLKTIESTDMNLLSDKNHEQNSIDKIIIKYLNLKKKINLLNSKL